MKILNEYEAPIFMWEGGANNGVSPPNSWEKEITCWQNVLSIFNEMAGYRIWGVLVEIFGALGTYE